MTAFNLEIRARHAAKSPMRLKKFLAEGLSSCTFHPLPLTNNACEQILCCLNAAGEYQQDLARFFIANALLFGANDDVWQILVQYEAALPQLRTYQWALCPILCTGKENTDKIIPVLCGWNEETTDTFVMSEMFSQESKEAVRIALLLATQYMRTAIENFAVFSIFSTQIITGTSLGLPFFLALCAATKACPLPQAYATGALSKEGDILKVGEIARKKDLCQQGLQHRREFFGEMPLIIPAHNNDEDMQKIFAAKTVQEALLLGNAHNIQEVRRILQDIEFPERFWGNVTFYSMETLKYVQEKIHFSIHKDWYQKSTFESLSGKLSFWHENVNKDRQKDLMLTEIICQKYPWEYIENNKEIPEELVWHLAMRHMRQRNYAGDFESAMGIWEYVKKLDISVLGGRCYEEYITGFSLVITAHHNRFDFYFDPRENLGDKFKVKINSYYEDAKNDKTPYKALVNYFGIQGQHAAFRKDYKEALNNFAESKICMHKDNAKDIRQTQTYEFFVEQDNAPCGEKATGILIELCKAKSIEEIFSSIKKYKDDGYMLYVILRYIADMPQNAIVNRANDMNFMDFLIAILENMKKKHPWQLIMYNLGRIFIQTEQYTLAEKSFLKGINFSFDKNTNPIIKAMALLPLHELWKMQRLPINAQKLWEDIREHIHSDLYSKHFKSIKLCEDVENAMQKFSVNLEKIFPFNYR